ncbi:MAG: cache domain-containing protein [Candidatus Tyrphobacter sp.]
MNLSLRARLIGAVVGAVVLIVIFTLVAARLVLGRDLNALGRTEVTSEASAFGGYLAAKQQQVSLVVTQEASADALRAGVLARNQQALQNQLSATAQEVGLSFLTALDTRGRVLGRVSMAASGTLVGDPLVQRALDGETVSTLSHLSQNFLRSEGLALQVGARNGGLAVVAVTPISDAQERTIGVLYGGVLLNHSYDLVDAATRAIGGATALLDGDTIVSSSIQTPDGTRFVDARVPAADAVLRKDTPFVGSDAEGGIDYLADIAPLTDDKGHALGTIWYGVPMSQITKILKHTTEALVLWGVIAMILVLALAIPTVQALSKTLVANSKRVREAAKELGVVVVGSEVSGDHISATKAAVERSGRLIAELHVEQPSDKAAELQRLNEDLHGDVIVIETLAQEMSNRMRDAADRVAELNAVAAGLNELVTGEPSSAS